MIRLIIVFLSMVGILLVMSGCQTMSTLYAEYKADMSSPDWTLYGPKASDPQGMILYPVKKGFGVTGDIKKIKACVGYEDVNEIIRLIKRGSRQKNTE